MARSVKQGSTAPPGGSSGTASKGSSPSASVPRKGKAMAGASAPGLGSPIYDELIAERGDPHS